MWSGGVGGLRGGRWPSEERVRQGHLTGRGGPEVVGPSGRDSSDPRSRCPGRGQESRLPVQREDGRDIRHRRTPSGVPSSLGGSGHRRSPKITCWPGSPR